MNEETMMEEMNMQTQPTIAPAKKKRGRPAKIEQAVFVEIWNKCSSLTEVAEVLGIPSTSASVRASQLRKKGLELSQFKRGRKSRPMEEQSV